MDYLMDVCLSAMSSMLAQAQLAQSLHALVGRSYI
jgi:hypothetical protein